uniref:Oxidative stress-responsive serine-rich protein 1 n=1 Tax=Leptobrachium leishanense TaxID=445787 RepID=A0A8C5Q959_9ANUR
MSDSCERRAFFHASPLLLTPAYFTCDSCFGIGWQRSIMESEAKDGDEDNLQSAFKKLRVDADGSTASLCSADSCGTRTSLRISQDDAKPKVFGSLKESWHGSSRKTTRGVTRTPRRRRSKSPVLHPPKFTHCSSKTTCSTPRKHKSLCDSQDGAVTAHGNPCSTTLDVTRYGAFSLEPSGASTSTSETIISKSHGSLVAGASSMAGDPSDFQSVSKLTPAENCTCKSKACQCKHWQNMDVYSFSGLRDMLAECERSVKEDYPPGLQNRTQSSSNSTSGSPRSCSEQARASVDDVTIEDLAGYMEYYLYIPKKMSHMAEMMYT